MYFGVCIKKIGYMKLKFISLIVKKSKSFKKKKKDLSFDNCIIYCVLFWYVGNFMRYWYGYVYCLFF